MRFYEMDLDEEGKELRINSFKEETWEKYKEYENNFYGKKIKELKEGFENLSISDNVNNAIRGVYRDLIFLDSVGEEKLKKFCEVNDANDFNQKAEKDFDEKNTIKKFKNHTLDYFIKKIHSKLPYYGDRHNVNFYGYDTSWQESENNIFAWDGKVDYRGIVNNYSYYVFNLLYEKDAKEALKKGHYYKLKFMSDLIKKYNLNKAQYIILLSNLDLLYTMFVNDSVNDVYGHSNSIVDNNNIDKIINNIKLLIPENLENYLTIHSLKNLKDNTIFYTDISKLVKKYSNITPYDILRLSLIKKDYKNLIKYLNLLDKCDNETKELILNAFGSIFNNTYIFPSIEEDKLTDNYMIDNEGYVYGQYNSTEIIEKNFLFFEAYDNFFENIFNYKELEELIKRDDCNEVLKAIILFKNSLIYNIPNYDDTRKVTQQKEVIGTKTEHRYEYDYDWWGRRYCTGEYYVVFDTYRTTEYLISGNLTYGKLEIENQQNIIELIKRLAQDDEAFNLNTFFNTLVKYRIDKKIYKYIETMLNQYNEYKKENKEKVLVKEYK